VITTSRAIWADLKEFRAKNEVQDPAGEEAHKGDATARIGQLSEDEESGLLDTDVGGTVEIPRVSATQSLKSCCVTAFTAS
jgi:hypothetical protein